MNKIVREHYPVENLPEDLRPAGSDDTQVTVTVVVEDVKRRPLTPQEAVSLARTAQLRHTGPRRSMDEIVLDIRALRNEWDD